MAKYTNKDALVAEIERMMAEEMARLCMSIFDYLSSAIKASDER